MPNELSTTDMTVYITSYLVTHDDSQVTGSIMHIVTYNTHSIATHQYTTV